MSSGRNRSAAEDSYFLACCSETPSATTTPTTTPMTIRPARRRTIPSNACRSPRSASLFPFILEAATATAPHSYPLFA